MRVDGGSRTGARRRPAGTLSLVLPIGVAAALSALTACNTTTTHNAGARSAPAPATAPAARQDASLPAPVPLAQARVAFAPLVGAPEAIAARLAEAVARQSVEHGLRLAPFGDGQADSTVKGYLSAETEGGGTRAIYVWDVLDRDLKRLHRVSGEATSPVTAAEPWAAIDGGTLEALARQSIAALAAWMDGG
jgi:hypothetical protein